MQSLCSFFLLAAEYDEMMLPSHFAEYAPAVQRRNVAKALRYFVSRSDFSVFQRQRGEPPNQWSTRLEHDWGLGAFAECVSPQKQIRAKNGRFYVGNTALLVMRAAGPEQIYLTLMTIIILSKLMATSKYTISSILDHVPEANQADLERILKELLSFLHAVLSLESGIQELTGNQWRSFVPEGAFEKAMTWLISPENCPPFFGEAPAWLSSLTFAECTKPLSVPSEEESVTLDLEGKAPTSLDEEKCPAPEGRPDMKESETKNSGPQRVLVIAAILILGMLGIFRSAKSVGPAKHHDKRLNSPFIESKAYPFEVRFHSSPVQASNNFFSAPVPPGS